MKLQAIITLTLNPSPCRGRGNPRSSRGQKKYVRYNYLFTLKILNQRFRVEIVWNDKIIYGLL